MQAPKNVRVTRIERVSSLAQANAWVNSGCTAECKGNRRFGNGVFFRCVPLFRVPEWDPSAQFRAPNWPAQFERPVGNPVQAPSWHSKFKHPVQSPSWSALRSRPVEAPSLRAQSECQIRKDINQMWGHQGGHHGGHHGGNYGPADRLTTNQSINSGGHLKAKSYSYHLRMQDDGNLVLYNSDHSHPKNAIWSSGTHGKGKGPYRLVMQDDGNLVVYDSQNKPTWASDTWNKGAKGHYAVVQDDGNFVVYDGQNKPTWASDTYRG